MIRKAQTDHFDGSRPLDPVSYLFNFKNRLIIWKPWSKHLQKKKKIKKEGRKKETKTNDAYVNKSNPTCGGVTLFKESPKTLLYPQPKATFFSNQSPSSAYFLSMWKFFFLMK